MKKLDEYFNEVESIKLALGTVQYRGGSIKRVFSLSLEKYLEMYKLTNDSMYLENALLHMRAFFEMGFNFEEFPDLFNRILKEAKTTREEMFPKRFYSSTQIHLSKSQVRSMIHRWSASKYHSLSINEVVDDIINKVQNRELGIYYYHSNRNPNKNSDDIYELIISEDETYFYDVARRKYYTFIQ